MDSPEADQYVPVSLDLLAQARSQVLKVKREIDGQVEEHSLALLCGFLNPSNKTYFLFLFALFKVLDDPDEKRTLPAPFCGNISHSRHQRYYQVINALRQYLGKPLEVALPAWEETGPRSGGICASFRSRPAAVVSAARET